MGLYLDDCFALDIDDPTCALCVTSVEVRVEIGVCVVVNRCVCVCVSVCTPQVFLLSARRYLY